MNGGGEGCAGQGLVEWVSFVFRRHCQVVVLSAKCRSLRLVAHLECVCGGGGVECPGWRIVFGRSGIQNPIICTAI